MKHKPWKPGHLFTDGEDDCYWAPEAFWTEDEYSDTLECMRYWGVVQTVDDIIWGMTCQKESRE